MHCNNKNDISCNIQGSKNILINIKGDVLKISGDNSKFTGNLIIPYNIKKLIFKNNMSYINNIKQLNQSGNNIMYIQNTNIPDLSRIKILKSI